MKITTKKSEEILIDLKTINDIKLLALRAEIDREARSRGLSFNVGEVGEKLVVGIFKERPDLPVQVHAPRGKKYRCDFPRRKSLLFQNTSKSEKNRNNERDRTSRALSQTEVMLVRPDAFERSRQVTIKKDNSVRARCWFAKSCKLPNAIID